MEPRVAFGNVPQQVTVASSRITHVPSSAETISTAIVDGAKAVKDDT
jgi:hypothetical protein